MSRKKHRFLILEKSINWNSNNVKTHELINTAYLDINWSNLLYKPWPREKDIATQRFTNTINQNDTHQQVLPQTDWKDVTSQTGYAEIPIKNKYVDTIEDGPIHGELTTVNPIERTEVTAKSEKRG